MVVGGKKEIRQIIMQFCPRPGRNSNEGISDEVALDFLPVLGPKFQSISLKIILICTIQIPTQLRLKSRCNLFRF